MLCKVKLVVRFLETKQGSHPGAADMAGKGVILSGAVALSERATPYVPPGSGSMGTPQALYCTHQFEDKAWNDRCIIVDLNYNLRSTL